MPFEVVSKQIKKTKEEILGQLRYSLEKNNAIGIFIKNTNELLTTVVVNIEDEQDGDFVINLKQHDLHGFPLLKTSYLLSDIGSVISFNIPFDDPQYVKERRREKFRI